MPLTVATDDAAFVAEVSHEMDEQCRRNREHNTAMIEEYLRRRLQISEEQMKAKLVEQETRMEATFAPIRREKDALAQKLDRTQRQLSNFAGALERAKSALLTERYFNMWTSFRLKRQENRQKAELLAQTNRVRQVYHYYLEWRLLTSKQQQRRRGEAKAKELRCQLEELNGQIDVFKEQLTAERRRSEEMEDRLKDAFVRGVSALNREAVHALHGARSDVDVAAIEDILSKTGGSRRHSMVAQVTDSGVSNSGQGKDPSILDDGCCTPATISGISNLQGICPVHHIDPDRNFYHRCYAPGSCAYGPAENEKDAAGAAAVPKRTPFVVHGNLDAVPNYVAGPQLRIVPSKTKPTTSFGRARR